MRYNFLILHTVVSVYVSVNVEELSRRVVGVTEGKQLIFVYGTLAGQ